MINATNTNVSALMSAAAEIRKGARCAESGAARLTVALAEAMNTRLSYKIKEDGFGFTLSDYRKPVFNTDGSKSGKHQTARLTAIMVDLLGEPEKAISNAVKTAFNKCYPAALLIRTEAYFNKIELRNGDLSNVPLELAVDLGSKTVQEKVIQGVRAAGQLANEEYTDAEALAKAQTMTVDTNGGNHALFGKLPSSPSMIATLGKIAVERGLVEDTSGTRKPRVTKANQDESQTLSQAIAFLTSVYVEQVEGDAEEGISNTFSEDLDKASFRLWKALGTFLEGIDMIPSLKATKAKA